MENIISVIFSDPNEAYRAYSEIKSDLVNQSCTITQMVLVKKQGGQIVQCEGYDTGITTTDDTSAGGLIGMCVGILGGPIGMLFGGALGMLVGSAVDLDDSIRSTSLLEHVSNSLDEGEVALIALAMEANEDMLNARLSPYQVEIVRWDAAEVANEIQAAKEVQKEMQKVAKEKLRAAKKDARKEEIEEKREKLRAHFDDFKKKFEKEK